MFKTVLYPVDRSREAQEAAIVVADIVKRYDSRLVILSVLEKPDEEDAMRNPMISQEAVEGLLKGAQAVFAQHGITAETIEREGKPAFVICDVADELNANLIVMGSRGLGLTEDGASESITTLVINLSPCPVLVVP